MNNDKQIGTIQEEVIMLYPYYYVSGIPMYYGNYYQTNPNHSVQLQRGWTAPRHSPADHQVKRAGSLPDKDNKGNICAYVSPEPVNYNKLNISHWPSQDYKIPYPTGFLHTKLQPDHHVAHENQQKTAYNETLIPQFPNFPYS